MPLRRELVIVAVMFLVPGFVGCAGDIAPSSAHPLLGEPMPEFERSTLTGEVLRTGHLRGRTIVVEFFAEFCAPCRYTLPVIEALRRSHPEVAFVGVSEDEHRADAVWLVTHYGLGFPVVHDKDGQIAARFAVEEMPATFVIDERGTIRWMGGPDRVESELAAAIRSAS